MTTTIVVEVDGGAVQAIYCNDDGARVYVVDRDNERAERGLYPHELEQFAAEREMREEGAALAKELSQVW